MAVRGHIAHTQHEKDTRKGGRRSPQHTCAPQLSRQFGELQLKEATGTYASNV